MVLFFTHDQGFTPVDDLCIEHEHDEQEPTFPVSCSMRRCSWAQTPCLSVSAPVLELLSFPILLGSKRVVSPQSGQQPLRRAFTNISPFSTKWEALDQRGRPGLA